MSIFMSTGSVAVSSDTPTLPTTFSTTYSAPGTVKTVKNSGGDYDNLQDAIDAASRGWTIVVDVDYVWDNAVEGDSLRLKYKTGSGWIYIVSAGLANLTESKRVSASDATYMPKIKANPEDLNGLPAIICPVIDSSTAPSNYRIVGFDISHPVSNPGIYRYYNLINTQYPVDTETGPWAHEINANTPESSYIWFDRCYIHNDDDNAHYVDHGIFLDGRYMALIDSRVEHFMGLDGMCIWIVYGTGPFKIVNNYLDAQTDNIMIGAADPPYIGRVPADIEIRGNYLYKDNAVYGANPTVVWNHIELKNSQRVSITGNWLENVYRNDSGHAAVSIEVSPRNASGTAPWCMTRDITIKNNWVRSVGRFASIASIDSNSTVYGADLVADASHSTNRRVASSTHTFLTGTFLSGDVGRVIEIVSGTGWTPGYYTISSVNASPNYAVLSSVAAADSSTGGVFRSGMTTQRVLIENNVAEDINSDYCADPSVFSIAAANDAPMEDVEIKNNLAVFQGDGSFGIFLSPGPPSGYTATGIKINNNIWTAGNYPLQVNNDGYYENGLITAFTDYEFLGNLLILRSTDAYYGTFAAAFAGTSPYEGLGTNVDSTYPDGNYGPHELSAVGFTAYDSEATALDDRDYTLSAGSAYKTLGKGGTVPGPNFTALLAAIVHAKDGLP
jgi:hypothetical protein